MLKNDGTQGGKTVDSWCIPIQTARLNGLPPTRAWLYHSEITAGGHLEFDMGPQPNPSWATSPDAAPPDGS